MDLWLKTQDVFMLPPFGNVVQIIETWQKIRDSWVATWPFFGDRKMQTTVENVGIDARSEDATVVGTWRYIGPHAWCLIAALKKDKQDNWKFRAIDYAEINQGLIDEIKTPE